jgi:hypothetical protein
MSSLKKIAMKLTQGSFAKRALMVGLIAGSGILAASAFADVGHVGYAPRQDG